MIEKYLNNSFFTLYFLPFFLGCLAVLSFQPYNFTFINFFILSFLFYLIIFINKKSKNFYRNKPYKKNLFTFGTAFGFGYYLSGIHWVTHSLTFNDSFKILIPFALVLIPLFLSLFFSLTILLTGPLLKQNLSSIFLFSGSLAFSDFLRSKILTGFPWNLWVYSFSSSIEILQILNKLGLFAFNLIIISMFMMPSIIFFKIKLSQKLSVIFLIPVVLFIFYIYGSYSINENKKKLISVKEKFNVKVISPNFELKYGLSKDEIKNRLIKLIRFSEPLQNQKTLFIWPEGVFSGYSYKEVLEFEKNFSKNFQKEHYILFGINKLNKDQTGFYNTLVVVNNKMEIIQEYKKQKLVPFGEFLPFEKILNKTGFKKITEGQGSFLKGDSQSNISLNKLNFLPLICYELIFTKFIQKSKENTNLIINISEDGWFGNSIGPHQHFAKASFRAIEHNSFLIRSANKGVSAIINNKGEIIKMLKPNEAGSIELNVPLVKSNNKIKNDLIFYILLITYILIFIFNKNRQ